MIDERTLNAFVARMRNRIRLMVGRVLLSIVDDAKTIQTAQVQGLAGEVLEDVERIQQYGFTSVPLSGAEGVAVFLGGERSVGLIIATDDRRFRVKKLQPGEVCLYTDEGDTIKFLRGKQIAITSGGKVSVVAPDVDVQATTLNVKASTGIFEINDLTFDTPVMKVTGDVQDHSGGDGARTMMQMRGTFNSHTHPETNASGGSTQPPNQEM